MQRFSDYVQACLPLRAVPSVPEIRLHLAGPHSGLGRWAVRAGYAGTPYWAHAWGGGLALARLLLDEPERVAGRSVLDVGTGSGLVAIAAALAGASAVEALDVDPYAVAAASLNAAANRVSIRVHAGDAAEGTPPDGGVVLAGDVFYAPDVAGRVTTFAGRCAAAGCLVLVGDPGRTHLPLARLDPIRSRPTPDVGVGHAGTPGTVYRLRAP